MAFDGNGLFNRLYNWAQDKANGIDITASRADAEDSGFAAGLSNCVTRDGQGKMGVDFLPIADNALNLGSGIARWANLNGNPISSLAVISNGTFTATFATGWSSTPTLTLGWFKVGPFVCIYNAGGALTATSNAVSAILSGAPPGIRVSSSSAIKGSKCQVLDGGSVLKDGWGYVDNSGNIQLALGQNDYSSPGFTPSGLKGIPSHWNLIYLVT